MMENLKRLDSEGFKISRDIDFLSLAIAELAIVFNWEVDEAVAHYKEVFESCGIKFEYGEFDAPIIVKRTKLNIDYANRKSIEEFEKLFGYKVNKQTKMEINDEYNLEL